jgi:hypothetical protein
MPRSHILLAYGAARHQIRQADLLLFRRRGLSGAIIAAAGRSIYSHAALADWWEQDLFCTEVREWYGGRATLLSRQVDRWPGRIDVYATAPDGAWPEFDRHATARYMRRLAGCAYGWRGIIAAAVTRLPILRLLFPPIQRDDCQARRPPFCSWAVTAACRLGGGTDPVPHLADCYTEPGDLARSPFFSYRFTLVP